MSEIAIERATTEDVFVAVLGHLNNKRIHEAIDCFTDELTFKDRGTGLEFKEKERLAQFFDKTRELFPDLCVQVDALIVGADRVAGEWTLHTTVTEPFYGGLSRKVEVSLPGVSVVKTKNGLITDWSDYYDGLKSRRTSLASYFAGNGSRSETYLDGTADRFALDSPFDPFLLLVCSGNRTGH